MEDLLRIEGLKVDIRIGDKVIPAVREATLAVRPRSIFALAGESGSGKTITALSITNILPPSARIIRGRVYFDGLDIFSLNRQRLQELRGSGISYIFQEPAAYLNPVLSIGEQVGECVAFHQKTDKTETRKRAIELLKMARMPRPEDAFGQYPHQLSGGMNQRAMIATALASNPKLLIADEPTTALDVNTQAEILRLLLDLKNKFGFSVLFITHDLSIVRKIADDVAIMYRGQIVESGSKEQIFSSPQHAHTRELISAYEELAVL